MTETRAIGFKLRGSKSWVFLVPEHVVAVLGPPDDWSDDAQMTWSAIRTTDGMRWDVSGNAEAIAALIWPSPLERTDDDVLDYVRAER